MLLSCKIHTHRTYTPNHVEKWDDIDTEFNEFNKLKSDNVTFSNYTKINKYVEINGKLNDDDIIKTLQQMNKQRP